MRVSVEPATRKPIPIQHMPSNSLAWVVDVPEGYDVRPGDVVIRVVEEVYYPRIGGCDACIPALELTVCPLLSGERIILEVE